MKFDWINYLDNTNKPLHKMPDCIGVSTNAVIFDGQGSVLLEKRSDNGFWGLSGGNLEIGESAQDAVIREVLEETGLTVTITRLIGIYSHPENFCVIQHKEGDSVYMVSIVFECSVLCGHLQISEESTDLLYHSINSLPSQVLWSHRIRIEDAMKFSGTPFIN